MFTAINKRTKETVTIYDTQYIEARQFHHEGYIAFLIFDKKSDGFFYDSSENYTIETK